MADRFKDAPVAPFVVDDGTLDTVIECGQCGEQLRFNPDIATFDGNSDGGEPYTDNEIDLMRLNAAFFMFEQDHDCS